MLARCLAPALMGLCAALGALAPDGAMGMGMGMSAPLHPLPRPPSPGQREAPQPAGAEGTLSLQKVAPGVFVHLGQQVAIDAPGHDDIANIGFVVGEQCVAVIDTGGSVRIGRALRAAIRRHTARPICYVVNTHVHYDHLLGNAAFAADKPSFIGHAALPAAVERSRAFFLQQYAGDLDQPPSAGQIIAPDRTVSDTLELDLGGRHLRLRAWPPAHTDCDLTAFEDSSDTLWTGDLLFRDRLPAVDGDVSGWLRVLDELQRVPARHIVPGHGPLATDLAAALAPERRYLQALNDGVQRSIDAGGSLQEAIAQVAAEEKPRWLLWDSTHPRNVTRLYQHLEWK
jgi:quinoprotein relay system zinc metallohydrolase 2